jgi:hypothetical protein
LAKNALKHPLDSSLLVGATDKGADALCFG